MGRDYHSVFPTSRGEFQPIKNLQSLRRIEQQRMDLNPHCGTSTKWEGQAESWKPCRDRIVTLSK